MRAGLERATSCHNHDGFRPVRSSSRIQPLRTLVVENFCPDAISLHSMAKNFESIYKELSVKQSSACGRPTK
jgi:hypothetical protein